MKVIPTLYTGNMVIRWLSEAGSLIISPPAVAIATVLGTALAVYRFIIKRPELIFDIEIDDPYQGVDGELKIIPSLQLANVGRQYAADVHVSFTLHGFEFENENEGQKGPETLLEIQSERVLHFMFTTGERHDLYFENVIYNDDVFELFYGSIEFEDEGEYLLDYTIACRSHGPRTGSILFTVEEDRIIVEREYPTWIRTWMYRYGGWEMPEQTRATEISEAYRRDREIKVEVTNVEVSRERTEEGHEN